MNVSRVVGYAILAVFLTGCSASDDPGDSDVRLDGSVDSEPDGDSADADAAPDLDDLIPNRCDPELAALIEKESYAVPSEDASVGWQWETTAEGVDGDVDFEGTFQGTQAIDTVINLTCPAHADVLGLDCDTSDLLTFAKPDGSGSTTHVSLAVPIPLNVLDLPAEGTKVSVSSDQPGLSIRKSSNSEVILHIGGVPSNGAESGDSSEVTYNGELDGVSFTMPASVDDPDAATCVTRNPCPRIIRLEPLKAMGSTSETIHTGSSGEISTQSGRYKIWNVLSYRRNDDHVEDPSKLGPHYPSGYCADIVHPSAKVIMARVAP